MARAKVNCPYCNKIAEVISESKIESISRIVYKFKCGHSVTEKLILTQIPERRDEKWNDFFGYQQKGVEFIEKSNFRCLIADEMGLGKTIEALGAIRYNWESLTPVVYICKASLVYNWAREHNKWVVEGTALESKPESIPIIHRDGQVAPIPGFKVYIISMDILRKPAILKWFEDLKPKTIIVDESHNFKNINSARTTAINTAVKNTPFRICLSGTPVMNNATEYFPTLNLIKPEHFPSEFRFRQQFIEYDNETKRWLALKRYQRDYFFSMTSSYIIRREKKDVLKDLPPLRQGFQYVTDFQKQFAEAYNKELLELQKLLETKRTDLDRKASFMEVLAKLARLRHITALAKVPVAYEYISEFLENINSDSKICIGIHHKDTALWLSQLLAKWNPVMISGQDSAEMKQVKEDQFREKKNRLAIVNIIAVGEGRNLQFCQNAVVLERQWNLAKEQQFEGRFQRPMKCEEDDSLLKKVEFNNGTHWNCPTCGKISEILPIQVDYIQGANTIDEFFDTMVKLKGKLVDNVMDRNIETDYHLIYQLAEKCVQVRMKYV